MARPALAPVFLTALLCSIATVSRASPVSYGIAFEVDYASPSTDLRVAIGNIYTGSFMVDDAVLLQDGFNKAGDVSAFNITMENVSWNMALHCPLSEFCGFRGPTGLGSASPGFDVVGGQITNLRGGVFGGADYPYVDFSTDTRVSTGPDPACSPQTAYCGNKANAFVTNNPLGFFGGSMNVYAVAAPVPEPETYAMLLLGLGIVGLGTRKQRRK